MGSHIQKNANLLDRIEVIGTGNYFTTLKDHKSDFIYHLTKRLINTGKEEIR